jgi:hypothetical protein
MSQKNVEVVQRFVAHWNQTGEPPWAEIDPDAVWVIDHARGVQSGATATQWGAVVFGLRAGRIVEYTSYMRREDALKAAGLGL